MPGWTLERELIQIARGVCEVADALKRLGADNIDAGLGVDFARRLTAAADAGRRGQDPTLAVPAGATAEQKQRDTWPVPPMDWPAPPKQYKSGAIPGSDS